MKVNYEVRKKCAAEPDMCRLETSAFFGACPLSHVPTHLQLKQTTCLLDTASGGRLEKQANIFIIWKKLTNKSEIL